MGFVILTNIFSDKKKLYIIINLILIFIFALIYWLIDYISDNYKIFDNIYIDEDKKKYTFIHYFWFSLYTQTTVGYNTLDNVYNSKKLTLFSIVNIIQLLSIFLVPLILI